MTGDRDVWAIMDELDMALIEHLPELEADSGLRRRVADKIRWAADQIDPT